MSPILLGPAVMCCKVRQRPVSQRRRRVPLTKAGQIHIDPGLQPSLAELLDAGPARTREPESDLETEP